MHLSIIIPFHRNLVQLHAALAAARRSAPDAEILVAADGAVDDCRPLAARFGATVVEIPGPSGPAVARNRAAAIARGDILVFVDADVAVALDSIPRLASRFAERRDLDAVFGAYDEAPLEPNFISQYKNLAHSFIHQMSADVAQTFWAGFGAIRRQAFLAAGGFDERFGRPSIEDIDLGYRLTAAGRLVMLDHELRATHLKRWTFRSLLVSDVRDRGIPWTQLILRAGRAHDDLNIRSAYRVCVVLSYLLVGALMAAVVDARALWAVPVLLGLLYFLSRKFYGYFLAKRGVAFTIRVVPLHLLYHLYNGVSFLIGTGLFTVHRAFGVRLPGALPLVEWDRENLETLDVAFAPPAKHERWPNAENSSIHP